MKLFFASDLHGCLPAAQQAVELFLASGADHFVILGDTLNHGPRNPVPEGYNPPAVAELLNQYAKQIVSVRGNCDSEVDQMLLSFPMMSDYVFVLLENGRKLFLTHGHLYNQNKRPMLNEGDIIAHGHTHIPLAERNGEHYIFNPGSLTFPRNGYAPSYGLLDNNVLSVVDVDGNVIVTTHLD